MNKCYVLFLLVSFSYKTLAQKTDFATVNFIHAEQIAIQYKGQSLDNLPKLAYDLTHDLPTDIEKFRAIYIWICSNIANDYSLFIENKKKRKRFQNNIPKLTLWREKFTKKVFRKLREDKSTVCTGYAYLLQELLHYANIKSEIIHGYGRTTEENIQKLGFVNHSWNAVQLSSKWYLCDATWASGIYNPSDFEFEFRYNDGYFLTDPSLFAKTHYPEDSFWLLSASNFKISDFIQGPIIYDGAFRFGLPPIQPKNLEISLHKGDVITFLLKPISPISIENLRVETSFGKFKNATIPNCTYNKNGFIEITYTFQKTGNYDFHIKMLEEYLVTYSVNVSKTPR